MKTSYVEALRAGTLDRDNLIKVKKVMFRTMVIWFGISLFLIIMTILGIHRLFIFAEIFNSTSGFFQVFGILMYILAISLLFGYTTAILSYIIYCENRKIKKEWAFFVGKLFAWFDIPAFILKCFAILLFIMIYMFNPCTVSGASMSPTFENGDKLIVSDFFYTDPKIDDVVIFDASNYGGQEAFYIKRVIATSGDTISFDSEKNELLVNGKKEARQDIDLSDYIHLQNLVQTENGDTLTSTPVEVIIPKNKIIVLGDNRANSSDSRFFSKLVDVSDVYGRVIIRIYPLNKIRFF